MGEGLLDSVRLGLDGIGMIPGLGEPADAISGVISLARGDRVGAALSFGSMIPIGGTVTGGVKIACRVGKMMDGANTARRASGGVLPTQIGKAGEASVRAAFDIGESRGFRTRDRLRIADGVNRRLGTVTEVKNVQYQGLTRQLRDYLQYAREAGLDFHLYIRRDTKLSGPLLELIDSDQIVRRFIP